MKKHKAIFVSWAPYATRSDSIAHLLNIPSHKIHYLSFKKPWIAPIKYIPMALKTLQVAFMEKPKVIFTMNPPLFCALTCFLYTLLVKGKLVIDSHHGIFLENKWVPFRPLHRFLAKRAALNIVTSERFTKELQSWQAKFMVLPVVLFHLPAAGDYPLPAGFNVAVVNTFSFDEPVAEILTAARQLPEVNFYITGDPGYADPKVIEQKPSNVTFTGFLEFPAYVALLKNAQTVMCLTTEADSIQNGASEALALGTPIITSDSSLMREVFPRGTVLVQNQPQSIIDGINHLRSEYERYKNEVPSLQASWQEMWKTLEQKLRDMLGEI